MVKFIELDINLVKYVLRYLKGIWEKCFKFEKLEILVKLIGFCDFNWGVFVKDRWGIIGYNF